MRLKSRCLISVKIAFNSCLKLLRGIALVADSDDSLLLNSFCDKYAAEVTSNMKPSFFKSQIVSIDIDSQRGLG